MSYEIKFLRNEDFEALPNEVTRGANIKDSLGFYNPYIKKAYIRDTGYSEVNKYLMDHEAEHMIEEHATDEDEFGIRHKKKGGFAKFFDTIFNPTTWANPERQSGWVMPLTAQESPFSMFKNEETQPGQGMESGMMDYGMYQGQQGPTSMGGSQGDNAGYGTYDGQDSFSGINTSLNESSQVNPFAPEQERFKYGAPAGRTLGF